MSVTVRVTQSTGDRVGIEIDVDGELRWSILAEDDEDDDPVIRVWNDNEDDDPVLVNYSPKEVP